MGRYLNDWNSKDDVASDFAGARWSYEDVAPLNLDHADIILASYAQGNYEGDAFVLFRDSRDGKLYEVNASHCSCFGLEGQWCPEETSVADLRHRMEKGFLGGDPKSDWDYHCFRDELIAALDKIEPHQ